MLTIVPEEEHETTLARWRGAEALIAAFHTSHRRLVIELRSPHDPGILAILAGGCKHFTGPFLWQSAEITLSDGVDPAMGAVSYLRDGNAGFELQYDGGQILWYGTGEDFKSEFKNFFYFGDFDESADKNSNRNTPSISRS